MAQSRSRQNSKQASRKKRDKRRLLRQQAGTGRLWLTDVDVPGWFHSYVEGEPCLNVYHPQADSLPSSVYEDVLPGEFYCTYYAHQHPELENEAVAASLGASLCVFDSRAGTKAEADGAAGLVKKALKELKNLAEYGIVSAQSCLGYLYMHGRLVRTNKARAVQYLRLAAEKNDPLACFWLSTLLEDEKEGLKFMTKSYELGFPTAVFFRTRSVYTGAVTVGDSELNMLAAYLGALASKGSMKSLDELLHLLGSPYGAGLRTAYTPAILNLLEGLVAENYAPAVLLQAELVSEGVLYEQDSEEAAQLYLLARTLGAEDAASEYAAYMLSRTEESGLTREEKKARVRAVRTCLEEDCSLGRGLPETAGLLGCILVMSGDDADFKKGIQLLEDNISRHYPDMALRAAERILLWSGSPEKHKAALKLLNALVRKKDKKAVFLRGRYYLDGGLAGRKDTAKGMLMLEEAASGGVWEASLLLAEISLFGLYNRRTDTELAAFTAKQGAALAGGWRLRVFYAMMQLGEFPGCPAPRNRKEAEEALRQIACNLGEGNYLFVAVSMARLDAGNPLEMYGKEFGCGAENVTEKDAVDIANMFAMYCRQNMRFGSLGALCYAAHALRKIGKTKYAAVFARAFASKLQLGQCTSCDDAADYLVRFVQAVPDSYVQYRLAHSSDDPGEDRPLY